MNYFKTNLGLKYFGLKDFFNTELCHGKEESMGNTRDHPELLLF